MLMLGHNLDVVVPDLVPQDVSDVITHILVDVRAHRLRHHIDKLRKSPNCTWVNGHSKKWNVNPATSQGRQCVLWGRQPLWEQGAGAGDSAGFKRGRLSDRLS